MKLSFKEYFIALWRIITFRSYPTIEYIIKDSKKYFVGALVLLCLMSLISLTIGQGAFQVLELVKTILLRFFYIALVFYGGKLLFKGKSNFLSLFSTIIYIDFIWLFYGSLVIGLTFLIPSMVLVFIIGFIIILIYYIMTIISVIKLCHKIKNWQAITLVIVTSLITFLLNKGFSLLLKSQTGNIAGQVVKLITQV